MWRKFWMCAVALLFIISLASVVDAQMRRPNANRHGPSNSDSNGNSGNSNQGEDPGNGNQGEDPGNGNQGEDPGVDPGHGTPDGQTPADEVTCDDLKYATPGLYGLCIAFCEAHDCEPVWDDDGNLDFSGCKKNDRKLLDRYRQKRQDGDPDMPCLPAVIANEDPATACPCWSRDQLSRFPYGLSGYDVVESETICDLYGGGTDRFSGCSIDSDYVGESVFLSDGTAVVIDLSVTDDDCGVPECSGYFGCNPEGDCPEWLPVSNVYGLELTDEEYLNCRDQIRELEPYCSF